VLRRGILPAEPTSQQIKRSSLLGSTIISPETEKKSGGCCTWIAGIASFCTNFSAAEILNQDAWLSRRWCSAPNCVWLDARWKSLV
jgi:hypothetical protein